MLLDHTSQGVEFLPWRWSSHEYFPRRKHTGADMLNPIPTRPQQIISILHVSPNEEGHQSLEMVVRQTNWVLHEVTTAFECLGGT